MHPDAQHPLSPHLPMITCSSRLFPPVSCPLVLSFSFLPLSLCVSSVALECPPSSPCGCLCVYLYISVSISFPGCLCLLKSLTLYLCLGLSSLLLIFAFSLCLALFSPSLQPSTRPTTHTSQPCLRHPQGGRWAGLQQIEVKEGDAASPPAVNLHASGLCGWQWRGKAQLPAWRR